MKKTLLLLIPVFVLLVASCSKKDDPEPDKNNNTNTTSPYYFRFTLDGKSYNLNANNPQYMVFDDALGGYQDESSVVANVNDPSIGLRISWGDNSVNESEVLALKGKAIPFYYDSLNVGLSFMPSLSEDTWFSVDTFASTSNYNVKITNITFLKDDVSNGSNFKTYVITGTCTALMEQGSKQAVLSGGEFNMIVAKKQD